MAGSYQIDMCHGPLFPKILRFACPLIFANILQLLFNAADLVVIGHYASHESVAAIGATLSMNSLVLNLFIGLAIGTNVLAARFFGAGDRKKMHLCVHTSIALAIIVGIALAVVALCVAKPLLVWMKTPEEVLPKSLTYITICFCAIPFIMIYNFGCSLLRAVGDTRRPLYYLIAAGIVNVLLNLFFVICCGMDVGGVALATAASHGISALLVLRALCRTEGICRFWFRAMRIDFPMLKEILHLGIPAGLQSACFSISNMLIQSSINSFGPVVMAAMTACVSLEGLVYIGSWSMHQTAISFVAQNVGGNKYKRMLQSIYECCGCAVAFNLLMGWGLYAAGEPLMRIFTTDLEVVSYGLIRMKILFTTYCFCGVMDVCSGALRGLGYSLLSTVNSLAGACLFRIFWVLCIFPSHHTLENLLVSYPISWALTALFAATALFVICRRRLYGCMGKKPEFFGLHPWVQRGFRYLVGSK